MRGPVWTASATERVAACPSSAALPVAYLPAGEHADRGTAVHAFMQSAIEIGHAAALVEAPEELREELAGLDLERLPVPLTSLAAEVALAWHPATGLARELGRGLERSYVCVDGEIAGTADAVGVSADAALVLDWKAGHQAPAPAAKNAQLRTLGLMAARAYRRDRAIVEIVRLREDGRVWRDRAELDAFDLDAAEEELRALHLRVMRLRDRAAAGEVLPVAIGPHCRYCPSLRHCPGQTALVRAVCGGAPMARPITPPEVAETWHKVKAARRILGELEAQMHAIAAQEPIDLGDGTVLGEVETSRREVIGEVAQCVLTELHGPEVAARACEVTVEATFSSIQSALRPVAPRGKLTALKQAAEAALEAAGGVRVKRARRVEVYTPRKNLAAGSAPASVPSSGDGAEPRGSEEAAV